jgi:hypothetical protein
MGLFGGFLVAGVMIGGMGLVVWSRNEGGVVSVGPP